ncbi:MAG: hypothetical protein AAGD96_28810, partial [Chloroflexota bacterium]
EKFKAEFSTMSQGIVSIDPPDEKARAVLGYLEEFIVTGTFVLLKRWIEEGMVVPADMMGYLVGESVMSLRSVVKQWPPEN